VHSKAQNSRQLNEGTWGGIQRGKTASIHHSYVYIHAVRSTAQFTTTSTRRPVGWVGRGMRRESRGATLQPTAQHYAEERSLRGDKGGRGPAACFACEQARREIDDHVTPMIDCERRITQPGAVTKWLRAENLVVSRGSRHHWR
jgi:hypothetical protein